MTIVNTLVYDVENRGRGENEGVGGMEGILGVEGGGWGFVVNAKT